MKRVKDIRESYNLITEKEEADINKLTSLVRAGLFDAKKLPVLKRILQKDVNKMTPAEKKILIELLDSLMSEVLSSQQVFSKVKQNVSHKDLNEAKDYLSKFDPRSGPKHPTEGDLPMVLLLKRKAIRVYPDQQKVALYYSQALDRYISIPFDNITYGMNEETIVLSEKKKADANTEAAIKYAYSQIKKNKNKGEDFADTPPKYLTKKQENQAIRSAARDAADAGDLEKLASVGAYKVGSFIRRLFTGPGAKERPKTPETAPPAPKKPVAAPTAPVTSMSGKFTQKIPSMAQPMKASVNIPKAQTPAPAPYTKAPSKKMSKVPGTGEQPSAPAGGFGFSEPAAKTKTFSYQTATTGARGLSPLEKSSGKIDPKKQVPRKRYGFDPKPAGVGPQPDIGKTKIKAAFLKKLSEGRDINEAAQAAITVPLIGGAIAAGGAAMATHLYNKKDLTGAIQKGIEAGKEQLKTSSELAKKERAGEALAASQFDAKKALIKRQRADERDAAEIAKVTATAARKPETPAIPTGGKDIDLPAPPKAVKDIDLPAPPTSGKGVDLPAPPAQVGSVETPGQKTGVSTPAPAVSQPADVTDVASAAAAKTLAQTRATSGTKVDAKVNTDTMTAKPTAEKDKGRGKNRPRPRFRLPSLSGGGDSDLKKFTQPGGFNLQAKINRPSEFDPLDTRKERERQRFLKSLSEEEDDAVRREVERRLNRKVYSKPKSFGTLKVNTSTPKGRSTDIVRSERERQAFSRSPIDDLQEIRNQNIKESTINIAGNQVIINNTIANKILDLYESLEDSNKQKMKEMLGESVESFKKIVNFAVRQ